MKTIPVLFSAVISSGQHRTSHMTDKSSGLGVKGVYYIKSLREHQKKP